MLRQGKHHHETEGTITVFLSLILLLILSLLFTIIESARIGTAKVYAERALWAAMDSTLAQYYGPLWEEYHVFGLDMGSGSEEEKKERITTDLMDYMSYTFEPNKEQNDLIYKKSAELYDISTTSLSISDETKLMDYEGSLLINEVVEYMKYEEVANGLEILLDKLSLLEAPEKVSVIYEEKQKVEEELVEIDKGILKLMRLLDGIKTSNKGIELTADKKLKIEPNFIKEICFVEPTKEAVGINSEVVFSALKDYYINPIVEIDLITANVGNLEQIDKTIQQILTEQKSAASILTNEEIRLQELQAISKPSKDVKEQMKAAKVRINELNATIKELQLEVVQQEASMDQYQTVINEKENMLLFLVAELLLQVEDAITIINQIQVKTEVAKPLIDQYENSLNREKENLGDEVFTGLEDGLTDLKRYITTDAGSYDFEGMKVILENNKDVLEAMRTWIIRGEDQYIQHNYEKSKECFSQAGDTISSYQIKQLALDYSTLTLDQSEKDPLKEINNILQLGILSLVIDPTTVSQSVLTQENLPSVIAALSKEDTDYLSNIKSFFENSVIGAKGTGAGNLFGGLNDRTQILSIAGNGVNKVTEHLLYQEYLREHFYAFPKEGDELTSRKPSVLAYEQEYLLAGKLSDEDNLASVSSRILLVRTLLDFVSLLGDKAKCSEAKIVAASLVGFTGLPILVSITQTLILLIWSFVEALVDVSALMMGKEVPILKKKIITEFPELFIINRNYLQSKASKVATNKELSFSYKDYLRIFLLTKPKEDLAYRSMDLMQENIKIRYNEEFSFENCLFGYEVEADYQIASKFTAFSFVQQYTKQGDKGFSFTTQNAYSY